MTTTMTKDEASRLVLVGKKLRLMPIIRPGGMFPEGHDGAFMFTGTVVEFVLPYDVKHNKYPSVFETVAEQEAFETLLGVDLNPYAPGPDNFWKKFKVRIVKDDKLMKFGYTLDLNDPMDALRYRMLKVLPDIAPSWDLRNSSAAYMFAIVDGAEMEMTKARKADNKKRAYLFFGKIENSREKMTDLLRVMGEKPANNSSIEWLKGAIDAMIEDPQKLSKLLQTIDDPNYEIRLFIEDGVDCGAIIKKDRKYYLPGGDPINPADPTLSGTIGLLKKFKEETDPIYMTIMQRIENSK